MSGMLYLVPATFLGSKVVDRRARLAGVRSRIHMPAIRYSMVSSCPVCPITSASIAKQALSNACTCTKAPCVCVWPHIASAMQRCLLHSHHQCMRLHTVFTCLCVAAHSMPYQGACCAITTSACLCVAGCITTLCMALHQPTASVSVSVAAKKEGARLCFNR